MPWRRRPCLLRQAGANGGGGGSNSQTGPTTPGNTPELVDTLAPTDTAAVPATVGYSFSIAFDSGTGEARLSGTASPSGEATLTGTVRSVGTIDNQLTVQNGPDPDGGAAVADAVTLLAAMRAELTAGVLSFDGQSFSMSGFYTSASAKDRLQTAIALVRTPVGRPDLNPDPSAPALPETTTAGSSTPPVLLVTPRPASFSIPADGRFHIFPLTLQPSGGSTRLCLTNRTIDGPSQDTLVMNYSSCGLARIVTLSASRPCTYTVTDTFEDEGGPNSPAATVTFRIVAT